MNRSSLAARRLIPLVLVALVAGTIAAQADDSGGPMAPPSAPSATAPPAPVPAAVATPAPLAATAPPAAGAVPVPAAAPPNVVYGGFACPPSKGPTTAGAPPSQALLDAFGILRRERRPADALPAEALAALKRANLAPVAPESARLLRTTPDGGRAWVVPVPDVGRGLASPCPVSKFSRPGAKPTPGKTPAPREGLAVVALGGAASGGGGALADLVRGRAPVAIDPCAGKGRDMLGVSGIVPEGVAAVFLTAPDGTAVKADVKDNGYEFLIPRPRTPEQRYVVWTGGDGTPHVQPVAAFGSARATACPRAGSFAKIPQITPSGFGWCALTRPAAFPVPAPAIRRDKRGRLRPPALAQQVYAMRCALSGPPALIEPLPATPRPIPAPVPHKHR